MPKTIQTINVDEDIAFSPEFKKMKLNRQLSPYINQVLRTKLDLKVERRDGQEIIEEIADLNMKRNILQSRLEEIKKKEEKEKDRYINIPQ